MLVSAALIVRNEEGRLGDCLRSLDELVDEVVVVDTGSSDRSVAIARALGARVDEVPWREDFSAARNAALDRCRAAWILYIDADERLLPCPRRELEKLLLAPRYLGHYVRLRMKRGYTAYWEMRLFRNDPEIRFRGVIHENIWPALKRRMRATGERVGYSELVLDHDGYEGDQSRKHERNLPLLLRALEADPERVYCWYHVGRIHRELARFAEARAALDRGIEVVRAQRAVEGQDSLVFAERLRLGLEQDEEGLAALVREARRLFPDQAYLLWLEGQILLRGRRTDEAAQRFMLLLRGPPGGALNESLGYDERLFSAWPLAGLATCRFQEGRYADAHELFAQAAAADSSELEYRVKRDLCERLARRSYARD